MRWRGAVVACLAILLLSFGGGPSSPAGPAAAAHAGDLDAAYMNRTTSVDAAFATDEYSDNFTEAATGITIYVQYSGNVLGVGLESPGVGWVALTLGGVLVGSNYSDLLIFSYDAGTWRALDMVDHGWERHLDEAIGGTDDIIASAGIVDGTRLRVEFQIPLDSADDNDHHFRANETYPLSVAYNATSPDPTTDHTAHSPQLLLHVGPTPMVMNWQATAVRALPAALVVGQAATLAGQLRDASGTPVRDQPLEFYQETTFGLLYLGLARTTGMGKASIEYEPRAAGTWTFHIVFRGAGPYLPSNETIELVVIAPAAPPGPLLPVDTGIALVILVVLAGVWGSYVFVASQLAAIRKSGRRALPRLPSSKGEGGENHS